MAFPASLHFFAILPLLDSIVVEARDLERRTYDELNKLIESRRLRVRGDPNALFSFIDGDIRVPGPDIP